MHVKLWSFFKKTNSLDVPLVSAPVLEFSDVTLKEGTSVLEPVIRIKWDGTTSLVSRSYAFIDEFYRYYYVEDIVFEDRMWNIKLRVDVLGTYRQQIRMTQLPVIRAAGVNDGSPTDVIIPDAKFPPGLRHEDKNWYLDLNLPPYGPWGTTPSSGWYTIGLVGSTTGSPDLFYKVGGSSFAQAEPETLAALVREVYAQMITENTTVADVVATAIGNLAKSVFNPGQFISSVTWFPFQLPTDGRTINSYSLGSYSIISSVHPSEPLALTFLGSSRSSKSFHIPLADLLDRDLNLLIEPYTAYYLEFWPFGIFPIDGRTLIVPDTTGIDVYLEVDAITGAGRFKACRSTSTNGSPELELYAGALLASGAGQFGVQIPMGGAETHAFQSVQATTGALTSIAAVAAGDFSAAGGIVSGALGAIAASAPSAVTTGACGGFSGHSNFVTVRRTRFIPAMTDYDHLGKAYARLKYLRDLEGFVQCWDGHVDLQPWSTSQEREEVERMLKEGVYV